MVYLQMLVALLPIRLKTVAMRVCADIAISVVFPKPSRRASVFGIAKWRAEQSGAAAGGGGTGTGGQRGGGR